MTFSEIVLDKFASGPKYEQTLNATIVVESICLLLSIILFVIRSYQVIQENKTDGDKQSLSIRLFQLTHLMAMFFSCFYIFLHEYNYINWYTATNPMDCGVWFEMIMFSITMSKIFTYSFFMLRSALSFSTSFFKISLKVSIPIVVLSIISQLTMMVLMISDYTPISPFPFNGFCFRILGENGVAGIAGFNFSDAISGFIAFWIFWWKSRQVKSLLSDLQKRNGVDQELMNLHEVFRKHIFFGVLIFIGSMLIFFVGEFCTVLMGVFAALHQLCNNIYIFLLFKENIPIYNRLCCRFKQIRKHNEMAMKLAEIQIDNKCKYDDDDKKGADIIFGSGIDRESTRSQSTFEIAPYNIMVSSLSSSTKKKSNSYSDLNALKSSQKDQFIKEATPRFDATTGGRMKLMNIPTQSSLNDNASCSIQLHSISENNKDKDNKLLID